MVRANPYPDRRVERAALSDRTKVLVAYQTCGPMTGDECAAKLGWEDVYRARRRVTECKQSGLLLDTGEKRQTKRGRRAAVLRFAWARQGRLF